MKYLVGLLACAAMLAAQRSEACGGPCWDPEAPFGTGTVLPANVPGIPFVHGMTGVNADAGAWLTLEDGGAVAASLTDAGILEPAGSLVPDERYQLHWTSESCNPGEHAIAFVAGAVAPLPTSLGSISAGTEHPAQVNAPTGSTCGQPVPASVIDLQVAASSELTPFLPITSWTMQVDGQYWAIEQPGAVLADGGLRPDPDLTFYGENRIDRVYTRCPLDGGYPGAFNHGLAPGPHQGTLTASIAGSAAPALPPVNFSFTLSCADQGGGTSSGSGDGALGCSSSAAPSSLIAASLALFAALRLARRRASS